MTNYSRSRLLVPVGMLLMTSSCRPMQNDSAPQFVGADGEVKLMTLDPGHFHAALVQKYDYPQVDSVVHVYAPDGPDLAGYLELIDRFNKRDDRPTDWELAVYRGEDYLDRMLEEKPGNVLVLAGNNARKIDYIRSAVENGIHVLADKPMIIHPDHFGTLVHALEAATEKGLVVNDVMTERHEITTILQRELSRNRELFGVLKQGTPDEPSISKESVHHFFKTVAGRPLVRPSWFFDVAQQGAGITDVSTHLVDLILWEAFPDEPIDYANPADSVEILTARAWDTRLTPSQFAEVTGQSEYPDYLTSAVDEDSILGVRANGEFVFKARGVHGKVSVIWNYANPSGGDTHFSVMRGTRADLVIRQDAPQNFRPTLYVEPVEGVKDAAFGTLLQNALTRLRERYAGLDAAPSDRGWEIRIPDEFREGHEDHFTRVTEEYLDHLVNGSLPEWERTNLLTKYFITTEAYRRSR